MWDRRYLLIPDEIDGPDDIRHVIVRDATIQDRNYYIHKRESELVAARRASVPSEAEIFKNAERAEYWTEEDKVILEKSDEHLKFLRSELARQKHLARKKSLEHQIKQAKKAYEDTFRKSENLKTQTAEYHAHEIAALELLQRVVLKFDETPLWPTEQEFLRCRERFFPFVIFLAHNCLSEQVWETSEIREVARSGDWRLIWTLSKERLDALFSKPISDLSMNQKLLIYWSRVYDSVYEDPKRPDPDIIEDDEKLDEWLANRDLEKSEDTKMDKVSGHQEQMKILDGYYVETCTCGVGTAKPKGLGEKPRHAGDCLFGQWKAYTPTEKEAMARQVYGRNSKRVREIMDREQESVHGVGTVEEHHLRHQKSGFRKFMSPQEKIIRMDR